MGAALVTGGAIRLGRAMALRLAERGLNVVVHYATSAGPAEETVRELQALGVRAAAVQADLLDAAQTDALIARASEAIGEPLTVLVNSASIFEYDNIQTATRTSWDRHLGSNLTAPHFLSQAFAAQAPEPVTDADGEPVAQANIVNMIDMRVRKLTPEFSSYTIAKAGLWAFTQTAAQGLAPKVRVNAIGPGPTLKGPRQSEAHFRRQRNATVLQRGTGPKDICRALDFILDSDGLTGQLLCIDGGQHLGWQTPDLIGRE